MKDEENESFVADFHMPVSICQTGQSIKIGFQMISEKEQNQSLENKTCRKQRKRRNNAICWLSPEEVLQKEEIPQLVKDLILQLDNLYH